MQSGKRTIYDRAHERVKEILSSHHPEYIDPKTDARIRADFPIKLDEKDMSPDNSRW
jgi:trimethylamine:corrinoid methyltransferase-like protein